MSSSFRRDLPNRPTQPAVRLLRSPGIRSCYAKSCRINTYITSDLEIAANIENSVDVQIHSKVQSGAQAHDNRCIAFTQTWLPVQSVLRLYERLELSEKNGIEVLEKNGVAACIANSKWRVSRRKHKSSETPAHRIVVT